jgi:hypothetical protein
VHQFLARRNIHGTFKQTGLRGDELLRVLAHVEAKILAALECRERRDMHDEGMIAHELGRHVAGGDLRDPVEPKIANGAGTKGLEKNPFSASLWRLFGQISGLHRSANLHETAGFSGGPTLCGASTKMYWRRERSQKEICSLALSQVLSQGRENPAPG